MPPTPPSQPTTRDEVEKFLRDRLAERLAAAAELPIEARRREAREEARDYERTVRDFLAVVDEAPGVSYDEALVVNGPGGGYATTVAEYRDTPTYWQLMAGDQHTVTHGPDLLAELRKPSGAS